MDFSDTIGVSAAGMRVQSDRLRVAAENLANAETTGSSPGADPYRRKTITFRDELDHASGASSVKVREIGRDQSDFQLKYDPSHPAANEKGYVKMPNVDPLMEIMDSHDAQHSYEANLNTMQITRSMLTRTVNLMKG
ncbi:flagellar basal body rod protein FlgC [Saccharibacter floricola]|uniref:Flagellar basal-body rod protein FlgC n=1 Tax=Saccharibacter floricola DSM 15669 TaxID=1123227 RepID=A0ABQ0NXT2_9PROT|nr:flagellar basal body rod protein FlgC [Saccharibacter floricola]GBQ05811.1 flagellar basal body rod protein FlgC [Saccharibacter floricola DSM 15669]